MSSYFDLSAEDKNALLNNAEAKLGRPAEVLEKDIWVCWALQVLFDPSNTVSMAFKGETSLSKVFDLIHRFSEDVDVTVDYRGLAPDFEPFKIGLSGNQKKVWSEKLKNQLKEYIYDEIVPRFRRCASEVGATIDVDENGEKLFVSYTREAGSKTEYLREQVLLEFGGRNITEPNEEFHVNPDIAAQYKHIDFPTARPTVLSPERTFWEKRTMNR